MDCLIAAVTERSGLALLHADTDLMAIARVIGLEEVL